ncbi:FAD-dependent oxidoreductase [Kineococcus radiotolerans]|uniref:Amine oxidase n=1 Tax=Kineococcus radiotolerans (strain ATCC BAA-149 / DSM 14245 / SRS30216) TaxID=266940 RepID=A6W8E0_KINRD|nr:FAD-dependent oxidoreductase [Kineococcus radiotolerans]ABS03079.1 amine oxidase [Kineococcus radiotolerans SRS30216 = ATCC BAA-149]
MTAVPTRPFASAVSRWGQDPWSRGSWSLIGRHGSPADRVRLGSPVAGRLRIAGEATHPTRAGMTHGAHEQGVAAADWALGRGFTRVAVVGAGFAGLAAARRLVEGGARVQVWEARERTGGRAAPVEVGGGSFDLGANWLQQYDDNVLARVGEGIGLRTVATDFTDPLVLGPPVAAPDAARLRRELERRTAAAAPGTSLGHVVARWLRSPQPWTRQEVRRFVDAEVVLDAGASLSWLSARHGVEAGVGEGDRWIVGSYGLLVRHLTRGLDVRLGRPVRRVETTADAVTLVGDGHRCSVDAVVVTVPVPVLAGGAVEFVPPLPAAHRAALSRLGAGRVEKVVLRFERGFWPRHPSGYYRVHGPRAGEVSEWLDATPADGTPTLVGLFAGPWVERLWAGTDLDVAEAATGIVRAAVRERAGAPGPG